MLQNLLEILESNKYVVVNIKEYNDHVQFKVYDNNKWFIINIYKEAKPHELAFKIAKQFKNKGEITL